MEYSNRWKNAIFSLFPEFIRAPSEDWTENLDLHALLWLIPVGICKEWNKFTVNNKENRTTPITSLWCLHCSLWTYFTPCSSVSIVTFEQLIAGWDWATLSDLLNLHYSKIPTVMSQIFSALFLNIIVSSKNFLLPCHAYFSPSDSTAKPKSASLTAAPFSLLASRRFSGWKSSKILSISKL